MKNVKVKLKGAGRAWRSLMICLLLLGAAQRLESREHALPPAAPAPKPVDLPAPATLTLANGLQVVVIERHALPLVTLRLVVRAGPEADPPQLPGLAEFTASLLSEGTSTLSALQIARLVDDSGGILDTGADWDNSYLTLTVLSTQIPSAFDLLADMAMHPAFSNDEVERIRRQTLSALKILQDDPGYMADTAFNNAVMRGTAYGHPEDGVVDSISRIQPQDIRRFHKRYYRAGDAALAVVGDITSAQAFALAQQAFGGWKKGAKPAARKKPPATTSGRQLIVIDKPGAVQTEIRVGNRAIARNDANYTALDVANQILGGPADNRLFSTLRTRHGLTYGASSTLICYTTAGAWEAQTSTRTEETVRAVRMVLDQMKHLRDHPISSLELHNARTYLIGHTALQFETSSQIANRVLDLLIHQLPLDYWNAYPGQVDNLTSNQVLQATDEYLDPENSVIVLVGDASAFGKDLSKLGPAELIPADQVDFAAAGLRRTRTGREKTQ
jgi:zinc protease